MISLVSLLIATFLASTSSPLMLIVTPEQAELSVPFDTTGTRWDPGYAPEGFVGYSCRVSLRMLGDTYSFGFDHAGRRTTGELLTFQQMLDESHMTFRRLDPGSGTVLEANDVFVRLDPGGFAVVLRDQTWATRILGADIDSAVVRVRLQDEQRTTAIIVRRAPPAVQDAARFSYARDDSSAAADASRVYPSRRVTRTLLSLCRSGNVRLYELAGRPLTDEESLLVLTDIARGALDSLDVNSFALMGDDVYCTNVSVFRVNQKTGDVTNIVAGSKIGEWWSYLYGLRISPTGRYLAINEANGTGHVVVFDLNRGRTIVRDQADVESFTWLRDTDFLAIGHDLQGGYALPSAIYNTSPRIPMPDGTIAPCAAAARMTVVGFAGDTMYIACGPLILAYEEQTREMKQIVDAGEAWAEADAALQFVFETP